MYVCMYVCTREKRVEKSTKKPNYKHLKTNFMKKLLHLSARMLLLALACCFSLSAYAQKLSVQGTVVDENGDPMIGASVVVMSGQKILGGYDYRYIR